MYLFVHKIAEHNGTLVTKIKFLVKALKPFIGAKIVFRFRASLQPEILYFSGVVMRTSYGTRLRARLRQAPYGDIVIGGSPVRSVAPGSASSSTHPATSSGITQLGLTTTLA